jgi:hypothetical protein
VRNLAMANGSSRDKVGAKPDHRGNASFAFRPSSPVLTATRSSAGSEA